MEIKRDNPQRKKSFRARHNCSQKKDKTTAGYWSCKMWSQKPVRSLTKSSNITSNMTPFALLEKSARSGELDKSAARGDQLIKGLNRLITGASGGDLDMSRRLVSAVDSLTPVATIGPNDPPIMNAARSYRALASYLERIDDPARKALAKQHATPEQSRNLSKLFEAISGKTLDANRRRVNKLVPPHRATHWGDGVDAQAFAKEMPYFGNAEQRAHTSNLMSPYSYRKSGA